LRDKLPSLPATFRPVRHAGMQRNPGQFADPATAALAEGAAVVEGAGTELVEHEIVGPGVPQACIIDSGAVQKDIAGVPVDRAVVAECCGGKVLAGRCIDSQHKWGIDAP